VFGKISPFNPKGPKEKREALKPVQGENFSRGKRRGEKNGRSGRETCFPKNPVRKERKRARRPAEEFTLTNGPNMNKREGVSQGGNTT